MLPSERIRRALGLIGRRSSSIGLTLAIAVATVSAQPAPSLQGATSAAPPIPVIAEYRVGPGDLLGIAVLGVAELSLTARVSNSGKIRLPHLGIIPVFGMTLQEIQAHITQGLRERGLVNEPWVQVKVDQYRANPVFVLGDVVQPGQFILNGKLYLLDLIAMAEGLTPKADPIAFLYRMPSRPPSNGTEESSQGLAAEDVLTIDLNKLVNGEAPHLNVELRGGDVLYVREVTPRRFYVVGDVNRPGVYELPREKPLLLSQAVAAAGGPARTAKVSKGMLVRSGKDGVEGEEPFDFQAILRGRQPDKLLRADDIVFIPGSQAKTIGYGVMGLLPNIASTAVVR
ncbi:MAG: polysaccharide biosynthesis/export family protein [Vicinamibacterales bacterium]